MPDKAAINKFLTEYFGMCWHEWDDKKLKFSWKCIKCNESIGILQKEYIHPDFFTPDGFFRLIELMKEKGVWKKFKFWTITDEHEDEPDEEILEYYEDINLYFYGFLEPYLNPETFAPAVAKFLGMEGE